MEQFTIVITATELVDTEHDGESFTPPRLVKGSPIRVRVFDENRLTVEDLWIDVTDELVDPEVAAVEALTARGFTDIEIGDSWSPGEVTTASEGAPIITTGTARR